jgi:hypothetical protein
MITTSITIGEAISEAREIDEESHHQSNKISSASQFGRDLKRGENQSLANLQSNQFKTEYSGLPEDH